MHGPMNVKLTFLSQCDAEFHYQAAGSVNEARENVHQPPLRSKV